MITVYNVHPQNPQKRFLESAARILSAEGGIAVYPTDSVYGLGACVTNHTGIDKIARLIERDRGRPFSFICSDFSQISRYVRLSNTHYRLMKRYLPGPYTFILNATNLVPKRIAPKRRTVGIRMPDSAVALELVRLLGEPLANTSVNVSGEPHGDHVDIQNTLRHEADVMLDAGPLDNPEPSTVVDLTGGEPALVRLGKGAWDED
jgi:tRNA threonylcarbamoyl adenosine modification protein (Sua5/YciO/YrdC/YwlC family)